MGCCIGNTVHNRCSITAPFRGSPAAKRPGLCMSYDLSPIASFARIKPLEADKAGGADSSKRISRWDEIAGTVEMTGVGGPGPGGAKTFEHMAATLPPEATQAHVYDVIAAPLVARWLGGVDVDLISYGQTGSGKTFTMFGPPHSMAHAAAALGGGGGTISGEGILRDEHGFILRSGYLPALCANSPSYCAEAKGGEGKGQRGAHDGELAPL